MILKIAVCVPTYNNPESVLKVVQDILRETPYAVLVVDDGSDVPVETLLAPLLKSGSDSNGEGDLAKRIHIQRFDKNRGKGRALRSAFETCVAHGFTHMVSIDGDGQHFASEIAKVVNAALEDPWALIIGRRRMESATVPGISHFGRAFSNFWVNYQTGVAISDSQSGFRLYPLFHVQNLKFLTKRYDFEIEVLIRLLWKNVRVREVEIDVFYPEPHLRISHFDKLYDNVRISILNTFLVVIALLRSQMSAAKMAWSFGVGIFLGCTPFYGLHTLLVALGAFAFRLNAGLMFIGSQVSIPPLAPLLVIGSLGIGHRVLGTTAPEISLGALKAMTIQQLLILGRAQFQVWLVGSLVLGAALGLAGGVSLFTGLTLTRKKKTQGNWNGRMRGGSFGNGFLKLVLKSLGLRAGYVCLLFLIPYFYLFAPKARRSLNEYWQIREPQSRWPGRQWRVMTHFYRYGQVLMDQAIQNHRETSLFEAHPNGLENILEAMKSGRGLILLSAHVGSWGLAAALLKERRATPLKIVQYRASGFTLNEDRSGDAEQSVFAIRDVLASGAPLGLMGDRPLESRFELVRFQGRLAPFDSTPFKLAAATGVPLIMTFGFKSSGLSYNFFATPPFTFKHQPGQDRDMTCATWVQEFADELSRKLAQYPDQWFNFFPFWSAEPVPPISDEASRATKTTLINKIAKTSHASTWVGI